MQGIPSGLRRTRRGAVAAALAAGLATSRPRPDVAIHGAFIKAIAADAAVKIAAQGQSFFSPTQGLPAGRSSPG